MVSTLSDHLTETTNEVYVRDVSPMSFTGIDLSTAVQSSSFPPERRVVSSGLSCEISVGRIFLYRLVGFVWQSLLYL